jgi:hypothetical protein
MMPGEVGGAGTRYAPIDPLTMAKRLDAADRPGRHLWVMTAAWIIGNPGSARDPDVIKLMDRENLVVFQGPGCFKCEQPYSARLAQKPCRGSIHV